MASSKKTQQATALPSLRRYMSGLSNMSPEQQKRILDAQHARSLAIAALPDKGMLGPSAKNKYLWVGTKVKKQGTFLRVDRRQRLTKRTAGDGNNISKAESWLEDRTNLWRQKNSLDQGQTSHSDISITVPLARAKEFDFEF